ncbi:MAG: CHAT domain-containing protein, partial [Symploca sp. SIO2B6]|nr:CHAT domain-containing protein [Symploca sp. SIO2B6]
ENPDNDTTVVENPDNDTTVVENPDNDTTVVENPDNDTTVVENPDNDTTVVENSGDDTTVVENSGDDTTVVENPGDDTTVVENSGDDTTVVENSGDDTTVVENSGDDTTVVENSGDDTTVVENSGDDTTVAENPDNDTTVAENPEQIQLPEPEQPEKIQQSEQPPSEPILDTTESIPPEISSESPVSESPVSESPVSESPASEPTETTSATAQGLATEGEAQPSAEETENNSPIEIERFFIETEEQFTREYESYLGLEETQIVSINQARDVLRQVEGLPGMKSALIYARFVSPEGEQEETSDKENHELELLVVTSSEQPIRKKTGIKRKQVLKVAREFRSTVTNRVNIGGYISSSKQLRKLLVEPMEGILQQRGIQNLIFSMDGGLRSVAVAALFDGEQFLIEQYSISLIPSLSLTNTRYRDIKDSRVLAMGAEKFTDKRHKSLPAVPLELSMITEQFWQGKSFIDDDFTRNNLQYQRRAQPFEIIHLATHADFRPGTPNNSYIQLWDTKLTLNELPNMSWNRPKVDLLVLSACRTALGNEEAELGFSGLAVKAGVKSSMGSLWYVSDEATLGLMAKFYQQLNSTGLKAEAIRKAQLAMLNGEVKLNNGQLSIDDVTLTLPPEISQPGKRQMRHPYYWAGFTLVGNPW